MWRCAAGLSLVTFFAMPAPASADLAVYVAMGVEVTGDDRVEISSYGSASETNCDGSAWVDVNPYVVDPGNNVLVGEDFYGFCGASGSVTYSVSLDAFNEGDYTAKVWGSSSQSGAGGCTSQAQTLTAFQAVWQYDHYDSFIGKHEYQQRSEICNGGCQPPRVCSTIQAGWASVRGLKASSPFVSYCRHGGRRFSDQQPQCQMPFGTYIGGFDDECQ